MSPDEIVSDAKTLSKQRRINAWHALMLILLDHLAAIQIPESVAGAFDDATVYWSRPADPSILALAKAQCWTYLATQGRSDDISTTSARRTRALLCVMEPNGDDEAISATAEWFTEMLTAGDSSRPA